MPQANCCPPGPFHLILAFIAFTLFLYFTDYLCFQVVVPDYFNVPGMVEKPALGKMLFGYICGGALFTGLFSRHMGCPPPWVPCPPNPYDRALDMKSVPNVSKEGFIFGVIISLIAFLPPAFIFSSLIEGWDLGVQLTEVVFRMVQFGIGGFMVAKIIGSSPDPISRDITE